MWSVEVQEAWGGGRPLPELDAFLEACERIDAHAPFDEHTLLTLQGHRQVPHARFVVREQTRLVGCAVLAEGDGAWYVEVAVHPGARRRGIGRALATAARSHVASHGGGLLRGWMHAGNSAAAALGRGADTARTLAVMARRLDGSHATAATRPLLPDEVEAWLTLSNAAFTGHPENGGWTKADLEWRLRADWTDLSRWPVLALDGHIVAGVWTKVSPGSTTGELYVVAVHPAHQGRGLGRVVVDAALGHLAAAGCLDAELYVDADNAPALALYRRAGFVEGRRHRCLEQTVEAHTVADPSAQPVRR